MGFMALSKNKKILIFGISGFTGKSLADALINLGYDVVGAHHGETSGQSNISLSDITNYDHVYSVIEQTRPNYIINMAAISHVLAKDHLKFYQVNTLGALNILQALDELNVVPRKIIFASSAQVYGDYGNIKISENFCPHPVNHYGNSKLAMENMVLNYSKKFPIVITRPFNYTGLGQSNQFLMPKMVEHFVRKQAKIELGNLNIFKDFSSLEYIIHCYVGLLLNDFNGIVNLCTSKAVSINEILDYLSQLAAFRPEVVINPKYVRADEIKYSIGDNSLISSLLHLDSKQYDFFEALKKMYYQICETI